MTGLQTINGKQYYFDNEGRQVKGHFVTINNQRYFLDGDSGEIARSRFVTENNKWYYVDGNGSWLKALKLSMVITTISTMIIAKSRVPG